MQHGDDVLCVVGEGFEVWSRCGERGSHHGVARPGLTSNVIGGHSSKGGMA